MSRRKRIINPGLYHVINRGVEKRFIFMDHVDYRVFRKIVEKSIRLHSCKLIAFAYMPNHYHLLIETSSENLSSLMRQINSKYSIYFNRKYDRVGPLWQGRFKSFPIESYRYYDLVIKYIENNPVKAGLVSSIGTWEHASSYSLQMKLPQWNQDDSLRWCNFIDAGVNHSSIDPGKSGNSLKSLKHYLDTIYYNDVDVFLAYLAGHTQSSIACYLQLSKGMISRKIKNQFDKRAIFYELKEANLLQAEHEYDDQYIDLIIKEIINSSEYDIDNFVFIFGKRRITKIRKSLQN